MISGKSKIIWWGVLLAFFAGWVNVLFLAELGITVSHMTGDLSKFSFNLVLQKSSAEAIISLGVVLTFFVLGAMISGILIGRGILKFGKPYGMAIIGQAALLVFSFFFRTVSPVLSCGLAACSCGMQNSLATVYRGIILRTTHVTGLLTDLGHSLGMLVSGREIKYWKIAVYLSLLVGFMSGTMTGGISYILIGFKSLLLVATGYALSGIIYFRKRRMMQRK